MSSLIKGRGLVKSRQLLTYMGMGFLSWGWVGQILEGGVNFFARGRGQIFFAKKGGKGVGKNFFAKNFLSLPVFLQS